MIRLHIDHLIKEENAFSVEVCGDLLQVFAYVVGAVAALSFRFTLLPSGVTGAVSTTVGTTATTQHGKRSWADREFPYGAIHLLDNGFQEPIPVGEMNEVPCREWDTIEILHFTAVYRDRSVAMKQLHAEAYEVVLGFVFKPTVYLRVGFVNLTKL